MIYQKKPTLQTK